VKFSDVILHTAAKVLVFIIMAFSVYLLFAGHHNPGGGFVGGLATASGLVLLYIAFDAQTVRESLPADFKLVGAFGVLVAVLTGAAPLIFDVPFLSHTHGKLYLPLIGETELTTALVFDVGVYLAVVGTAMTMIQSISEDE